MVYDCSARFKGTSLNDQLLQGPDLTNTLVGVLTRFRQEQVALIVDVEAMFYQVRVSPTDYDVLRFLWWPEGNLDQELEEYRMVEQFHHQAALILHSRKPLKTMKSHLMKRSLTQFGRIFMWMTA